jgi:hypothetical protein
MKGIKCTSNEVNAILAGDKSQIRLVIKHQPNLIRGSVFAKSGIEDEHGNEIRWPHQIGDLVFVKEDFCEKVDQETFEFLGDYHYRASCDFDVFMMGDDGFSIENKDGSERLAWKPAQHMKQNQSRITLRIKDISVERLQEISEDDCWAEGGEEMINSTNCLEQCQMAKKLNMCIDDLKPTFAAYWNATHKKPEEKWEANPWIWKIEFEVVK